MILFFILLSVGTLVAGLILEESSSAIAGKMGWWVWYNRIIFPD